MCVPMCDCFHVTETPSTGSKKDGIPRAWSLGLHPFPEGEIKEWAVPEASEPMDSAIQFPSPESGGNVESTPSGRTTIICRHLPISSGFDKQPYYLR